MKFKILYLSTLILVLFASCKKDDNSNPSDKKPPIADFTANPTNIQKGSSVNFTDYSSNNPTSYLWTFTNGSPNTSTEKNPIVTYNTSGTFSVTLTVTNKDGSDTKTKSNYIVVAGDNQKPIADFSASATTIKKGSTVTFTDVSLYNPTSYSWTFEGGTPNNSTQKSPTITYNTIGSFSVSLTVTNAAGSDIKTISGYITVSETKTFTAWGVDNNYHVWKWNGTQWDEPNTNARLSQISISTDGQIWGCDQNYHVWKWNGTQWDEPNTNARIKQISVGSSSNIWGVDQNNRVWKWNGSQWIEPNTNARLSQISVASVLTPIMQTNFKFFFK